MNKIKSKVLCVILALVMTVLSLSGSAVLVSAEDDASIESGTYQLNAIKSTFKMFSINQPATLVVNGEDSTLILEANEKAIGRYGQLFFGGKYDDITEENVESVGVNGIATDTGLCFVIPLKTENISADTAYDFVVRYVKGYSEEHDGDWYKATNPPTITLGEFTKVSESTELPEIIERNADYSAVEAAKEKIPEDLSIYTSESVQALNEAVSAVVEGKKYSEQAEVNAMAEAIENAIDALIEIEKIQLVPTNEELMFKVVNAYIEKAGDKAELVFALSGTGYEDVIPGTYDDAVAVQVGSSHDTWIHGEKASVKCDYWTDRPNDNPPLQHHEEGEVNKWQFRVPVNTLPDSGVYKVPIVAVSKNRYQSAEKADAENPDYSGAFTSRQFVVNLDEKTVRVGNLQETIDVAVNSAVKSFAVEDKGQVYTVGTPKSNEYTCQVTITMKDNVYDKAFLGTAEEAASAETTAVISPEDQTFVLNFYNTLGGKQHIVDGKATAAFHIAMTGEWIERTFIFNLAEDKVIIEGEEISKESADVIDAYNKIKEMQDVLNNPKATAQQMQTAVTDAKTAYDKLSAEQKAKLENGIVNAEEVIKEAQKTADQKAQEEKKNDSKPASDNGSKKNEEAKISANQNVTVNNADYKVTKVAAAGADGTVTFTSAANQKSVTVPDTVKLADGKTYKVTQIDAKAFKGGKIKTVTIGANVSKIAKKAFKGSKATKLIVKSKNLKKKTVKGSLKGSKIKTVKVKVGNKKQNKKYVKKYKKIFTKKNAGKKVTVK